MGGRGASFEKQGIIQLKKGIRSLGKQIARHTDKISQPEKYIVDYESRSETYKEGIIRKWKNEIRKFEREIDKLKHELKLRG